MNCGRRLKESTPLVRLEPCMNGRGVMKYVLTPEGEDVLRSMRNEPNGAIRKVFGVARYTIMRWRKSLQIYPDDKPATRCIKADTSLVRIERCGVHGMVTKYVLTPEGEDVLRSMQDEPNVALQEVFGVSMTVISRWRREYGLWVSAEAFKEHHVASANKWWTSQKDDPSVRAMLHARGRTLRASYNAARRRDEARLRMGLPQASKISICKVSKSRYIAMRNARYLLSKHGYLVNGLPMDDGVTLRYDSHTHRREDLEARYLKRFGWKFLPEGAEEEYVRGRDDSPLSYGFTTKY